MNIGTTAIYFSWQKIPWANLLGTKLIGGFHRFYFDTRDGVMVPGDKLQFEFLFKAERDGVFTQSWFLQTRPLLCGGWPVVVRLTGFAYAEDLHAQQRQEITVCQLGPSAHTHTHTCNTHDSFPSSCRTS